MTPASQKHKKIFRGAVPLTLLLAIGVQAAQAQQTVQAQDDSLLPDWKLTSNLGFTDTNGYYGTLQNTNVQLSLASLSLSDGNFKFTASVPYMRISGRGLVVFDASGNPILINRRTSAPTDVRTGWGDLDLAASYVIPPTILDGFEVRLGGLVKAPTASARHRLSTGKTDVGASIDVSRQFGIWTPFVTIGYLDQGRPAGYTLYNTTSVSVGTSLELSENLVAVASYDYDSANAPIVAAGQELSGSLSWVCTDKLTLTGYGTVGLSSGSPAMGVGFQISYGFN
ncbi:MAG TPA: hypothetical protein VHC39_03275 [Rhizomicrobium sp.]|nr:hypothetical protein [Rhizomicrobium sp.]